MSKLLTLGAGGITAAGPNLWTPSNDTSLLSWFDTSADRYDGTTWTKRYGTGPNAIKETTGPTESTTAFPSGTQRALVFTGNSNTQLFITPTNLTEWIEVAVFRYTTRAVDAILVQRDGYTNSRLLTFSFGGIRVSYLGGDVDDYDVETLDVHMIVARHSKNSRIARLDGTQILSGVTATSGTESATAILKLGVYDGTAQNWTAELTCYGLFNNSTWTTTLAQKIEGFIAHDATLGITTANLPAGHPYKTVAPEV